MHFHVTVSVHVPSSATPSTWPQIVVCTPAMAAGVADHVWTYEEMAALVD
jgi:hypothetical protein